MDMLFGENIAAAKLTDWRKLAQGLHARFTIQSFSQGAEFVEKIAAVGAEVGHAPKVALSASSIGLELVSDDAIYRDEDGSELIIEWVTAKDIDLARRISAIAAELGLSSEPASVSEIELGLDVLSSGTVAPVWAAILSGEPEAQGRGQPGDEVRDALGRGPNLWFGELSDAAEAGQRVHVEICLAAEEAPRRIAAALAAGGTIVDDSKAPGLIVIADQEGNRGIVCVDTSAVAED